MAPGEEGQWDSHGLLQGQAFHNTDTQTYIWYSDWYTRNTFPTPVDVERGMARPQSVGLLTLRRDGFGYLSKFRLLPATQPGMQRTDTAGGLLSQSVTLAGPSRLLLNIDQVADSAPLEISLVDDAEQPLSGFEPIRVVESGLRVPVKFAARRFRRARSSASKSAGPTEKPIRGFTRCTWRRIEAGAFAIAGDCPKRRFAAWDCPLFPGAY